MDYNQIVISNLMMNMKILNGELDENLLRYMILNSIKKSRKKFKKDEYGEMILACDDKDFWRKQIFPYYKAHRKKNREESDLDWNEIFSILNKIRDELKIYMPYRVIQVDHAEADDVIATLIFHRDGEIINNNEKTMILSGDKDFIQLQQHENVFQYDPIRDRMIEHKNPKAYEKEHIIRGDVGDGVPNFLSVDNSLVDGIRQSSISKKKLQTWLTQRPEEFCDTEMLRNYKRNEMLVSLKKVPAEIQTKIIEQYKLQSGKKRDKLFNYFTKNRLKKLMEHIQDF